MTRIWEHVERHGVWRERTRGMPDYGVLLVGEDNPHSADPRVALYPHPSNASGARLCRILRLRRSTYLSLWRANLCTPTWDAEAAAIRASHLAGEPDAPWDALVMLGAKVAGAFGYRHAQFTSVRVERVGRGHVDPIDLTLAYLPHPSGLTRTWNDPSAAELARMLMKRIAPHVPVGEADGA